MRLTSQVINSAPIVLNAENQLTLQLRNLQIPQIENLGITQDKFSVIDLTGNDIVELGNIPSSLISLQVLLLGNNNVSYVSDSFPSENNIRTISLINNNVTQFHTNFYHKFKSLENLALLGNPICELKNYRLFMIWLIPSLRILDFQKVKQNDRILAIELFGQNVEDMNEVAMSYLGKQAVVLESASTDKQLLNIARKLTDDERGALLKKLETAESLEEIEHIENTLKSGHV
jgi:U2 small nuclear ribonucleoprotein A'